MDFLQIIKKPIATELNDFIQLFNSSLVSSEPVLVSVLDHIRQRGGKRMRPILTLLTAKNYGEINETTHYAAMGLELLHTASLVHDDVVDESSERRGQPSVNASYNNKVAVLTGDYILSTALLNVSKSKNIRIVESLSRLGQILAAGELLQMNNYTENGISEKIYFDVIEKKTASLFANCSENGAISAGADDTEIAASYDFGLCVGKIFQIRDDIFDYYDSKEIGKPTGNDMLEGKLTLPIIYALKNTPLESMYTLARKVKNGTINPDEVAVLVEYAKMSGGIQYAISKMDELSTIAMEYIDRHVQDPVLKDAFVAYLQFVSQRNL
jgi:octaprenyl-diphosphate synthase